jgi:hypothetical protein
VRRERVSQVAAHLPLAPEGFLRRNTHAVTPARGPTALPRVRVRQ